VGKLPNIIISRKNMMVDFINYPLITTYYIHVTLVLLIAANLANSSIIQDPRNGLL
jgi:hypothetical protein